MPPETDAIGLLLTAFVLGLRHGIDWDHIAAISDITSTSGVAEHAEEHHLAEHASAPAHEHEHRHGGEDEVRAHGGEGEGAPFAPIDPPERDLVTAERRPVLLGTLYALGHALVVVILGSAALFLGAQLPDWVDPVMGRVVGVTLLVLGVWVFISLYSYARHGGEFRLRSRWMLVFDGVRHLWRRFQARIHGHAHVEPMEMSSYGPRTAFTVGMIHGIGAETGTQVVFLTTTLGAVASFGSGIPILLAFVVGLVVSNTAIVVISASGFLASRSRRTIYLVVGAIAGVFSLVVGTAFLLGLDLPVLGGQLPVTR